MDFRLLGPLEASEQDRPLPLGGVKQRSLLAILLLHANELVSRLRKALGDGRIATHPPGYVLRAAPGELDLARFEQLAAEASRAPPASAAGKLRAALALWRGPALAGLAYA